MSVTFHQTDEILISRINRKVLHYSLLWPSEKFELNPGSQYKFLIVVYFLITAIVSIPMLIRGIFVVFVTDKDFTADDTAVGIAFWGTYYMVCFYIKKRHELAKLQCDLSNFNKFGKPPGFDKLNQKLDFYSKILFIYIFITINIYVFINYPNKEECKENRKSQGLETNNCGMVFPFWLPFETNNPMVYYSYTFGVLISAQIHMKMCTQISFHLFELVSHIILRKQHLQKNIIKAFETSHYQISKKKLKKCVLYHNEILKLAETTRNIFSVIMFGHFAVTGTICACIEKQIIQGYNVYAGSLHFIAWIAALFFGCLGGQTLLNSTDIIPSALWQSKWYESDLRLRKSYLIMLTRSQRKSYIGAGPFGILSYPLFLSVLKASYSILCVLSS